MANENKNSVEKLIDFARRVAAENKQLEQDVKHLQYTIDNIQGKPCITLEFDESLYAGANAPLSRDNYEMRLNVPFRGEDVDYEIEFNIAYDAFTRGMGDGASLIPHRFVGDFDQYSPQTQKLFKDAVFLQIRYQLNNPNVYRYGKFAYVSQSNGKVQTGPMGSDEVLASQRDLCPQSYALLNKLGWIRKSLTGKALDRTPWLRSNTSPITYITDVNITSNDSSVDIKKLGQIDQNNPGFITLSFDLSVQPIGPQPPGPDPTGVPYFRDLTIGEAKYPGWGYFTKDGVPVFEHTDYPYNSPYLYSSDHSVDITKSDVDNSVDFKVSQQNLSSFDTLVAEWGGQGVDLNNLKYSDCISLSEAGSHYLTIDTGIHEMKVKLVVDGNGAFSQYSQYNGIIIEQGRHRDFQEVQDAGPDQPLGFTYDRLFYKLKDIWLGLMRGAINSFSVTLCCMDFDDPDNNRALTFTITSFSPEGDWNMNDPNSNPTDWVCSGSGVLGWHDNQNYARVPFTIRCYTDHIHLWYIDQTNNSMNDLDMNHTDNNQRWGWFINNANTRTYVGINRARWANGRVEPDQINALIGVTLPNQAEYLSGQDARIRWFRLDGDNGTLNGDDGQSPVKVQKWRRATTTNINPTRLLGDNNVKTKDMKKTL